MPSDKDVFNLMIPSQFAVAHFDCYQGPFDFPGVWG